MGGVIEADTAVYLVNDMVLDFATKLDAYNGAEDEDTVRRDLKIMIQRAANKLRAAIRANAVEGLPHQMTGEHWPAVSPSTSVPSSRTVSPDAKFNHENVLKTEKKEM
jgi:hypothetical protein